MKVLVTGVKGQLGFDVVNRLQLLGIECCGVDMDDFDITDAEQTEKYIMQYNPEAVCHCAAYTAVDKAEDQRELCYDVNVVGTKNIAEVCKKIDAKMMYISTDYIFSGQGLEPFEVDDTPSPINYYGFSKYEGEQCLNNIEKKFIIRISWVFGKNGHNFIRTILRLGRENNEIRIVADQIGSPTYTFDLAKLICDMLQTEKYGIYHATNEGYCSWYDFARYIAECGNLNVNIIPITSEEFKSRAVRPKNSRLSKKSLDTNGFNRLPDWKDAIKHFFENNNL